MSRTDRDLALTLYRTMCLLRAFDAAGSAAYGRREIHGTYRGSRGQEAIPVGVCQALRPDDVVFPSLRGVGENLARGTDPRLLMAELFARSTGLAGGRAGSLQMGDPAHGVMSAFGVLTANVPMATGAALAQVAAGDGNGDAISVCFFGDQATNEGVFHESLNVAALLSLPVLYVGINNAPEDADSWLGEHTAAGSMAALAAVHAIPAEVVDGTDVLEVYERTSAAIAGIRGGQGPFFLECQSYPLDEPSRAQVEAWKEEMRQSGEYTGMVLFKKSKIGKVALQPPEHWLEGDPLRTLEAHALTTGLAAEAELAAIRADVERLIDDALAFARQSPEPDPATATAHVYAPALAGAQAEAEASGNGRVGG